MIQLRQKRRIQEEQGQQGSPFPSLQQSQAQPLSSKCSSRTSPPSDPQDAAMSSKKNPSIKSNQNINRQIGSANYMKSENTRSRTKKIIRKKRERHRSNLKQKTLERKESRVRKKKDLKGGKQENTICEREIWEAETSLDQKNGDEFFRLRRILQIYQ